MKALLAKLKYVLLVMLIIFEGLLALMLFLPEHYDDFYLAKAIYERGNAPSLRAKVELTEAKSKYFKKRIILNSMIFFTLVINLLFIYKLIKTIRVDHIPPMSSCRR